MDTIKLTKMTNNKAKESTLFTAKMRLNPELKQNVELTFNLDINSWANETVTEKIVEKVTTKILNDSNDITRITKKFKDIELAILEVCNSLDVNLVLVSQDVYVKLLSIKKEDSRYNYTESNGTYFKICRLKKHPIIVSLSEFLEYDSEYTYFIDNMSFDGDLVKRIEFGQDGYIYRGELLLDDLPKSYKLKL